MTDITKRVFLSYAKENVDKVDDIYHFLHASGIDVWMDKYGIIAGEKWNQRIDSEIESSAVFIAFLSRASVSKTGTVQREFKFALEQQLKRPEGSIFVIPAMIEECEIPGMFSEYHCIDLTNLRGANALLESIKEVVEIRNKYATGDIILNKSKRPIHEYIVEEPEQNIYNKDFVVVAPFKGMFYRGPDPDKSPFCRKGEKVFSGDGMFILEKCKTFIMFRAHRDGIVTTFLANNDTWVEENDPLLVFRPLK